MRDDTMSAYASAFRDSNLDQVVDAIASIIPPDALAEMADAWEHESFGAVTDALFLDDGNRRALRSILTDEAGTLNTWSNAVDILGVDSSPDWVESSFGSDRRWWDDCVLDAATAWAIGVVASLAADGDIIDGDGEASNDPR